MNIALPEKKSRWLVHVLGWVMFFVTPLVLSPPGDFAKALFEPDNLISLVLRNGLLLGLFYLNLFYLTPVILQKRGIFIFLIITAALVTMVSLVNWYIHNTLTGPGSPPPGWQPRLPPPGGTRMDFRPIMFASPLFSSFLISGLVVLFSTSLFLWDDRNKTKELAREQELQKTNAELAALKLQISPHFLFNTLNNIRWLVRSKSDLAEDSLVKLSQLLRYILYRTSAEKVELSKEIEHLTGYINLQTMRLADTSSFDFRVSGDTNNKTIVPLLLLPIVENLFKHADFTSGFRNTLVLEIKDHRLIADSENKIAVKYDSQETEHSGIGLTNLEKRLAMHYPGKHMLTVNRDDIVYRLHLEILLN